MFKNKNILITGGTGSFGSALIEKIVSNYKPKKIVIYSRDELKQFELKKKLRSHAFLICETYRPQETKVSAVVSLL